MEHQNKEQASCCHSILIIGIMLAMPAINLANSVQISARDGKPIYFDRYNSTSFCPNSPSHQEAYQKLIDGHIKHVQIDALMSDDLHFLPDEYSCVCEHCQKRFLKEAGLNCHLSRKRCFGIIEKIRIFKMD